MNNLFSTAKIKNIYKRPMTRSEIVSQIIYGEKVKILKKGNTWLKIKTLTGKEIEINVEPDDVVKRIKDKVEEKDDRYKFSMYT